MTWLRTNDRQTDAFGSEKIVCPARLSAQVAISSASLFPVNAARVAATLRSNVSRIWTRDVASAWLGKDARSNSGSFSVTCPHQGRFERCVARPPTDIDFVCGFQASRSFGTRSSSLRVVVISWSNSGSSASTIGMDGLLCRDRSADPGRLTGPVREARPAPDPAGHYDGLRPKSTFGVRSASGGALKSGYSLKP